MQTDSSVLYPSPDYEDGDLLSKELCNYTFVKGLFNDLNSFRPPLERYNVTDTKLVDMNLIKGNIKPSAYDISMQDFDLDKAKEIAWLPTKRSLSSGDPIIIYNPLNHYSFVEWVGINSTEMFDINSDEHISYYLRDLYYDDENSGIFGMQKTKDEEGNILSSKGAFFSLKTNSLTLLADVPIEFIGTTSEYVGYVQGAYILMYSNQTYVSFTLTGEVYILRGYSGNNTCLGDDGIIAIESNTKDTTSFFNIFFDEVSEIEGSFCGRGAGFASSPTKYLFGTKIGRAYFFLRDNESSYKFRNTAEGWKASITDTTAWKYTKRLKYDYSTDNWLRRPRKSLHYNMIKQGLFVRDTLPPHKKGDSIVFENSDMYGDFAKVAKSDGSKTTYQTFDFKKWEVVTGDAPKYLYGCMGRVWISNRQDGVSGLMPYTIVLKSVSDYIGGKKTVLQFSGFIFRGGQ